MHLSPLDPSPAASSRGDLPRAVPVPAAIAAGSVGASPAPLAAGAVADACRAVLEGYAAGASALDAAMLQRLVRLGDVVPEILADEARLTMAFGALRQVLAAFDCAEHRDAARHPQPSAALQAVYRLLGLAWPGA
ncbi:MAG TPA: hypothetical protein PLK29_10215 [Chiayiivirga sp.]|jgi:hypothetical protein|nr:hypothetical protein [Chiayiivirga sp.]